MRVNKYFQYMIKKFWSYLLIGLMSASFIVGPLGMLCGLIPVIICSIVCTINDFTTLKKNPNNQLALFTKSHIIYALILLITNIGWGFVALLIIFSYQ